MFVGYKVSFETEREYIDLPTVITEDWPIDENAVTEIIRTFLRGSDLSKLSHRDIINLVLIAVAGERVEFIDLPPIAVWPSEFGQTGLADFLNVSKI